MNEAHELLRRVYKVLEKFCIYEDLQDEILNYLANQETAKDEPVEINTLARACNLAGIAYKDFLKIKAYMPIHPAKPEDKPVVVIDDNFGSKQLFKDIAPHSHVIDIHVRYCGAWYVFEGDWIKQALPRIEFNQIDNRGIKFTLESHKIKDYTRPAKPERKPMTEEEIMDACRGICVDFRWPSSVIDCIRHAEKHHGIGGDDA